VPQPEERRPATDAEARALASALRLRILRLTLDEALTNKEIADRLGLNPATVLHHVRTLVSVGFLQAQDALVRDGARHVPYRSTGRSWHLSTPAAAPSILQAFVDEVAGVPAEQLDASRLGLRLDDAGRAELGERLQALLDEFAARAPDPAGRPWSVFLSIHPDPGRR
jgi:DNA-binding transcriptional ArsR family regulator